MPLIFILILLFIVISAVSAWADKSRPNASNQPRQDERRVMHHQSTPTQEKKDQKKKQDDDLFKDYDDPFKDFDENPFDK